MNDGLDGFQYWTDQFGDCRICGSTMLKRHMNDGAHSVCRVVVGEIGNPEELTGTYVIPIKRGENDDSGS